MNNQDEDFFEGDTLARQATIGARIFALQRRRANNHQMIGMWENAAIAYKQLRREYRGRDQVESGMIAHFLVGCQLAAEQMALLREENISLETEIAELLGQGSL